MDRNQFGDQPVKTVLLAYLVIAFTTACAPGVGGSSSWIAAETIQAPLQVEIAEPRVAMTPPQNIRVVTFNVHYGEDVDALARTFQNNPALQQADIILIQEIQSFPEESTSRARRLADVLGMGYVYAPARSFGSGTHGLAILNRYPLQNVAVMELPKGEIVLSTERRIALRADVTGASGTLRLINVHLDTRLNATERILQLRPALLDAPEPTVVGGDFNTNPLVWAFNLIPIFPWSATGSSDQSSTLDQYMKAVGYQTPTAAFGETVSYPLLKPRIDSIYVRGLNTGAGAVERDVSVSDHWPLWLDISQ